MMMPSKYLIIFSKWTRTKRLPEFQFVWSQIVQRCHGVNCTYKLERSSIPYVFRAVTLL